MIELARDSVITYFRVLNIFCHFRVVPQTGKKYCRLEKSRNSGIFLNLIHKFLGKWCKEYKDDIIILVCDNAPWHGAESMIVPENIIILNIPPYTPEMNPIEQIWTEIRKRGFKNVIFKSLDAVIDKLCDVVNSLEHSTVSKITSINWMFSASRKS